MYGPNRHWLILVGVGRTQPIRRVDLDAVDPKVPMHMWTGDTPGSTDLSDQLTSSHMLANGNVYFCLVIKTAVYPLAVVDDGNIAAYSLQPGVNDHTIPRSIDIERVRGRANPIINPAVEGMQGAVIIGAAAPIN